jgi:hypothetical protein
MGHDVDNDGQGHGARVSDSLLKSDTVIHQHGPAVARLRGGDGDIQQIAGVSFTVDARPAPGNPFHLAFPVHDLEAARTFWGGVLKCKQGRELAGGALV